MIICVAYNALISTNFCLYRGGVTIRSRRGVPIRSWSGVPIRSYAPRSAGGSGVPIRSYSQFSPGRKKWRKKMLKILKTWKKNVIFGFFGDLPPLVYWKWCAYKVLWSICRGIIGKKYDFFLIFGKNLPPWRTGSGVPIRSYGQNLQPGVVCL